MGNIGSTPPLSAPALSPFVPRVLTAWVPAGGEHLTVDGSLVFADISGFTALSERLAEQGKAGAEELTAVLTDVFTDLLGVAEALGGDLLSFGGDALLLLFSGPDHPQRAARAAASMRARLKARGPVKTGRGQVRLRISMGVHTGEVFLVAAGERQRELLVVGPAATAVTDMESAADAGEILCSPSTAAALPPSSRGDRKGPGILLARMPAADEPPAAPHPDPADLDPYLPAAVRRLVEAGIDEPEHRYVAVAFVHLGGLDAVVAEHGAAHAAQLLHELVTTAESAATEAGVTLIASDVAGDGAKLILTSGAPSSMEDGEARLLVAARALATIPSPLRIRVGVHAGHVYAGTVGAPWRRVYTVMGDAVNLSARLMGKATPGQVVASRSMIHSSSASFELQALEPFMVKGKSRPQEAYVVGPKHEGVARQVSDDVHFVGRAAELEQLGDLFERIARGAGACVSIVGEAGIGKSRLLDEAIRRAEGVRTIRVVCDPLQTERAYFAARLALRAALDIPLDADQETAGRLLSEVVRATDPDLAKWVPLIATTISATTPSTPEADDIDPGLRASAAREATDLLLSARLTEPIAFVFEDAGRMDESSAALFARLALGVRRRPWLLCTTSRGEAAGLHPGLGYDAASISLRALTDDEQHHLATVAAEAAALSDHDLAELTARAAGNPLFLIELVRARAATEAGADVPTSLEGLVAARIDAVEPVDRRILRYASVLGARFPRRLLEISLGAMLPLDGGVWRRLDEFLLTSGPDLQFRHDLVREVAYDGLPFRLRRDLHRRVADAIGASSVLVSDALMATHYDRAGVHDLAWRHGRAAGDRARASYANADAATQYERALHNGEEAGIPPTELAQVAEAMGDVSQIAGQYDRAARGYQAARAHLAADDPAAVRLLRKEGVVRDRIGKYDAATRWYRKGLRVAEQLPHDVIDLERADLLVYYAGTLYRQGRNEACIRWCLQALDAAQRSGNQRAEAHASRLLFNVYSDLGRPDADAFAQRVLPIAERLGDFVAQGAMLSDMGVTAFRDGQWTEAADLYERSRQAQTRAGDVVGAATSIYNLAEIRGDQGRLREAEELFRAARRTWRASRFRIGIAFAAAGLSLSLGRLGRFEEALQLADEAEATYLELGMDGMARETRARRAIVIFLSGDPDAADHLAAEILADTPPGESPTAILTRIRAVVAGLRGDLAAAGDGLRASVDHARTEGSTYETALGLAELARLPGIDTAERAAATNEARAIVEHLEIDLDVVLLPVPWADVSSAQA